MKYLFVFFGLVCYDFVMIMVRIDEAIFMTISESGQSLANVPIIQMQ